MQEHHVTFENVPEHFGTDNVEQPGLQPRQRCNTTAHDIQVKTAQAAHKSKSFVRYLGGYQRCLHWHDMHLQNLLITLCLWGLQV